LRAPSHFSDSAGREDHRHRVHAIFARVFRRRAVDRLEHAVLVADVAADRHPHPALKDAGEIGDDVAEHVGGDAERRRRRPHAVALIGDQPRRFYDPLRHTNMFRRHRHRSRQRPSGRDGDAVAATVGDEHGMFEPIHGSAPKHAGKDRVNPMAMILATASR